LRPEHIVSTPTGEIDIFIDLAKVREVCPGALENQYLVQDFLHSWVCLLADSPLEKEGKPAKVIRRFLNWVLLRPIKETILSLSSIADKFLASCTLTGEGSTTGTYEIQMEQLPVYREYLYWFKTGDPESLTYVMSFLYFGKKLHYVDGSFNATALRGWLGVEEKLEHLKLPNLGNLRTCLEYLLADRLPPDHFRGRYGPGFTAEGYSGVIQKSRSFWLAPKVARVLDPNNPLSLAWFKDPRLVSRNFPVKAYEGELAGEETLSSNHAKLTFVPKNVKTARSICMEPNGTMYVQQHFADVFVQLIENNRLHRFVTIHDQTPNQHLSEYGSWSGNVDTIDLSAASDSLSLELVKGIFPRHMLYAQLATRTGTAMLPDGSVRKLKKFAPMGSALCFPTQSIVFSAAVLLAYVSFAYGVDPFEGSISSELVASTYRRIAYMGVLADHPRTKRFEPFRVYGDDIVCDSRITGRVLSILAALGFSVNSEKSFMGSQAFRESCGKFHWNGHDVTPLRFSVKFREKEMSASCLASYIDVCNRTLHHRYFELRRYLIRRIIYGRVSGWKMSKNPIRFSTDLKSSFAIHAKHSRNSHLEIRDGLDSPLHRREVKAIGIKPKRGCFGVSNPEETYRLSQWWRASDRRCDDTLSNTKGASAKFDPREAKLGWIWAPA
jgi:hypothetical protein